MKLTVIIPSRGRVRGLATALTTCNMLASGRHEITYGVCCDDDDPATSLFCAGLQREIPLAFRVGPRPSSMGAMVNDMAERMPADVYVGLADDIFVVTPNWDDLIARAVEWTPYGVFWPKNVLTADTLAPIVTEKWRQVAGALFTDHYPFWYDDLCLLETWVMATDQAPLMLDVGIVDKPVYTNRMRDLSFWQDFFIFTRQFRVKNAKEIAKKLGLPEPQLAEEFARRITDSLHKMPRSFIEHIERNQGETSPPDAAYIATKARAEAMMRMAA